MSTTAPEVVEFDDDAEIDVLLEHLCRLQGSDLHIKAGSPPYVRVDGRLQQLPYAKLKPPDIERMAFAILPPARRAEFDLTNEADFALGVHRLGRFRVNVYRQRGSVAMVLRRVLIGIPSFEALGLPPAARTLAEEPRGLVLVTGPTGSGKTTSIASMIDHINATRMVNIVTIEDPIEVIHQDKSSLVSQREIGSDTEGFAQAMRRVLRQDPDVIFVGEMRDPETVSAALSAAETGHLVLSTLHTSSTVETINRIVDFFPSHQHRQIRQTVATSLRGVLSQRLLERSDGTGRIPAVEVLVNTGRVFDRIIDPSASGDSIDEIIADGEWYGMQTFDQSLLGLIRDGLVEQRDAMGVATNPHDLRIALQRAGIANST
ncbi:MAG TPA: PilT/PilU family type 4a pilus ATPase [Acidimicrobiales bacterium]|nr:PilT/PilU family type 4a pilus ATPase [Acidimicrobiales bacterium]